MNVYRKMQTAAFGDQVAENEIGKCDPFWPTGDAARAILVVDGFHLLAGRVVEVSWPEVGDLELHGDATLFLIVFKCFRDELQIAPQVIGKLRYAFLLHPAVELLLLERNVDFLVRIAMAQGGVIEGVEE